MPCRPAFTNGLGTGQKPLAGKRPNGIPGTSASDKEHMYESATKAVNLDF